MIKGHKQLNIRSIKYSYITFDINARRKKNIRAYNRRRNEKLIAYSKFPKP